ncbi:MAG: alpha/beta hydrolase-fold protein [Saprospiraceae bacterium]
MQRILDGWYSPSLNKHMEIVQYGHYGFGLLLLPTAGADYLEYERFQLIDAITPMIEGGKCKVFSVNSINSESWLNRQMHPPHKAIRHNQFNEYIYHEVIPYIKTHTSWDTPIIIAGASLGALHSANLFFKKPALIDGLIAMSGDYDLQSYSDGYFDEQVYFNSPAAYMANMHDENILNKLRSKKHIYILTGSGSYEAPDASRRFSQILSGKGIPHQLDIWGYDMAHDWPTWRAMLPHYLATRF